MQPKEFYVAIELGSSKITGIAGQKKMDGSITVLAVATEEAATCIRKGVVYNIDKTNQSIRNIITKLQNTLKTQIKLVHVGIGGQGIRSLLNRIPKDFLEATVVSNSDIDAMMDSNRATKYPNQIILDVAPQEYKVDSQYQMDPAGIECIHLEGQFMNIVWRDAFYRNHNKCFEQAGMPTARYYLAPMALADYVLTDSERRTGCALVDLGAGTTTVSVYYKNVLRHMVTIPLGGYNITKDIASFHIDELEAEKMKIQYASAFTNASDVDPDMKLPIDSARSVPQREFISMVEARVEEIIKNVLAQIPTEYADKLSGGIILTGGTSNMKNMEIAFRKYSNIVNVRTAKTIANVTTARNITIPNDGTLCTALALLAKSDEISSGLPLDEATNMFAGENADDPGTTTPRNYKPGAGQVLTESERKRQEEEERKRQEEEERKRQEEEERKRKEEEERKRQEEEERRRNSFGAKTLRGISKFFKKMIEDEEEK